MDGQGWAWVGCGGVRVSVSTSLGLGGWAGAEGLHSQTLRVTWRLYLAGQERVRQPVIEKSDPFTKNVKPVKWGRKT